MWTHRIEELKFQEQNRQIVIDKGTRVQPNDSIDEVKWKIRKMLRNIGDINNEVAIDSVIQDQYREDVINGLQRVFSVKDD